VEAGWRRDWSHLVVPVGNAGLAETFDVPRRRVLVGSLGQVGCGAGRIRWVDTWGIRPLSSGSDFAATGGPEASVLSFSFGLNLWLSCDLL